MRSDHDLVEDENPPLVAMYLVSTIVTGSYIFLKV
jgi:hypothetical protein